MKRLIIGFLVGLALLNAWPAFSEAVEHADQTNQSDDTLTLEKAIQIAIANNPKLQAERAKLGISEAEITKVGFRVNPALITDNGLAERTYRIFGLEQTAEVGGKRKSRVALARAQRDVVLSEIDTAVINLRADVRRAYTGLYNAQQRQQVTQEIVDMTEHLGHIARKREKAGDISTLEAMQTQIVALTARNELETIVFQVIAARNQLNAVLKQPVLQDVTLAPPPEFSLQKVIQDGLTTSDAGVSKTSTSSGKLPLRGGVSENADLDTMLELAFRRRPEVKKLVRDLDVTSKQLSLAYANRIPDMTVTVGPDMVTEPTQRRVSAFIMGRMDLPVFNRQQGQIQEAKARRIQLESEQAALNNQITLEVHNAYTAFISNRDRLLRYEKALLPEGASIMEKSRRAFEEGKTSILIPMSAQQAYINTRLGYLQTLLEYQNAISDLERAIGVGL